MRLIDPSLIITSGYSRALLVHPVRQKIHLIPIAFAEIIGGHRLFDADDLLKEYGDEAMEILEEYHLFLDTNGYLLDERLPFIPAPVHWELPHRIATAIVGITTVDLETISAILSQLDEVGCHSIEFRITSVIAPPILDSILSLLDHTRIRSACVILPFSPLYHEDSVEKLVGNHLRLCSLVFFDSPENYEHAFFNGSTSVRFSARSFHPVYSCGTINMNTFDFGKYKEAQTHNSCLNRKVSISSDGTVGNCPGLASSYGNIASIRLKDVISTNKFQDCWTITKDQVKKCRDCEFRFFCYDCRAFLEDPADRYSKPLKCGYDPYSASWEKWSDSKEKRRIFSEYERMGQAF